MISSKTLDLIKSELATDAAHRDVTVQLLGPKKETPIRGFIRAQEPGVFAGQSVVRAFQTLLEGTLSFRPEVQDGTPLESQQGVVSLSGSLGDILSIERTLLNFLSHLSGIASLTAQFRKAVSPYPTKILATRKTTPGLRELELEAVVAGGGFIHRRSLSDGILIKENHQVFAPSDEWITQARRSRSPLHRIEVEVQRLEDLPRVLACAPDIIMLDNFSPKDVVIALHQIEGRCEVEVSGGITLSTIRAYAETGVPYISVGCITHSAPILNLSMEVEP